LPGYSATALHTYESSLNFSTILHHPLNAPFLLLTHGIIVLHTHHTLLILRGITAGLGLATLVLFCVIVRYWHGTRTALFGTLLLGTSSWFLPTARSGTPLILTFGLFALIACGVWLRATASGIAVLLGLVIAALLVYVPGMIWLIGLGIVWQWHTLDRAFKKNLVAVTLAGFLFVALIAPLVWSVIHTPALIKPLLNLPDQGWPVPLTVLHNLIDVPINVFIHGKPDAPTPIGQLPVLDVFGTIMFFLGGYVYLRHLGLHRSRLLLAIFIGSGAVVSLGGSMGLSLLVPFLYLIIAVGVGYMLDQWFTKFPRNPIAQAIGMGVMSAVVLLTVSYHLRLYFVAWPQNAATQSAFTVREP